MTFPFSPYDFSGLLVAGFLVIGAVERSVAAKWLVGQELKLTTGAFWVGIAYILGHIVAHFASLLFEHALVRGRLGSPANLLFEDEPARQPKPPLRQRLMTPMWWVGWLHPRAWWMWIFPCGVKRRLFPVFCKPLPPETRARVLAKSGAHGFAAPGEALFYHCHTIVKRDKPSFERMTMFLNQYGFCRNVCMASLISAAILAWGACNARGAVREDLSMWSLGAVGVALAMFYRYVKFYRHYAVELFISYAEFKEPEKKAEGE